MLKTGKACKNGSRIAEKPVKSFISKRLTAKSNVSNQLDVLGKPGPSQWHGGDAQQSLSALPKTSSTTRAGPDPAKPLGRIKPQLHGPAWPQLQVCWAKFFFCVEPLKYQRSQPSAWALPWTAPPVAPQGVQGLRDFSLYGKALSGTRFLNFSRCRQAPNGVFRSPWLSLISCLSAPFRA